jgi:hypothetical protein
MVLLFSIIIFLCAAALILFNFKWTKKIDVTLQDTQFHLGTNEDGLQTAVKLHGTIKKSWNRIKSFQGTIEVEGEVFPTTNHEKEIIVTFQDEGYGQIKNYYWQSGGYFQPYGLLFVNNDISKLAIIPYFEKDGTSNNGWSAENGRLIIAPAVDKQEAIKIAKDLITNYIQVQEF